MVTLYTVQLCKVAQRSDLNSWWRHQMETFSALLAICAGNSPGPVNSPHKGQWCGALMFSLVCTRINGWVNNGEASDLRRHRAHYEVTVMLQKTVSPQVYIWSLLIRRCRHKLYPMPPIKALVYHRDYTACCIHGNLYGKHVPHWWVMGCLLQVF